MTHFVTSPLGTAELVSNDDAIAGRFGTWTFRLTVGRYGVDSGGQIQNRAPDRFGLGGTSVRSAG